MGGGSCGEPLELHRRGAMDNNICNIIVYKQPLILFVRVTVLKVVTVNCMGAGILVFFHLWCVQL